MCIYISIHYIDQYLSQYKKNKRCIYSLITENSSNIDFQKSRTFYSKWKLRLLFHIWKNNNEADYYQLKIKKKLLKLVNSIKNFIISEKKYRECIYVIIIYIYIYCIIKMFLSWIKINFNNSKYKHNLNSQNTNIY